MTPASNPIQQEITSASRAICHQRGDWEIYEISLGEI
jgi:hypothetical protein